MRPPYPGFEDFRKVRVQLSLIISQGPEWGVLREGD
jgi:hypothetical protein